MSTVGHHVAIDGHTRLIGILGWPVRHSLSPAMHNAAFAAMGLNFAYVPLPVQPRLLEQAVRGLVSLGFAGANVTVPHKSAILPYLDQISGTALTIGAVNTLVISPKGQILGDNTDGYGFMTDLAEKGWAGNSAARRALVIGAGGAARAVAYGLAKEGVIVAVANRSFDRAVELCQTIGSALALADPTAPGRLSAHRFPQEVAALGPAADLIVNATHLGLRGNEDPLPWDPDVGFGPNQLVYDLVPSSASVRPTPFLRLAASGGAKTSGGLGMLLHQGAKSFEIWTGMRAPLDMMRVALRAQGV